LWVTLIRPVFKSSILGSEKDAPPAFPFLFRQNIGIRQLEHPPNINAYLDDAGDNNEDEAG
jgi:hypothetical protein